MPRCKAYETAAEAIAVAKLSAVLRPWATPRLITVSPELTTNGDGFVLTDVQHAGKLWDANGNAWQARVHASAPDKYKLVLERWGTNAI